MGQNSVDESLSGDPRPPAGEEEKNTAVWATPIPGEAFRKRGAVMMTMVDDLIRTGRRSNRVSVGER